MPVLGAAMVTLGLDNGGLMAGLAASTNAVRGFGAVGGIFQTLSNGVGNLGFGFKNLGTAGTIGTDAIKQGAVQAGTAFIQLGAVAALAATAVVVGFGIAGVKAAGDFQQGITTLETGAGELHSNLALVAQGILNLSTITGTSTQQLIAGMFQIESAGYRGAQALAVLQTAAEGAKVGNADLGTVANAVTTVMKDYGISANNSASAMNFLTAIVQNGKTTLQDLAASMSQVLPAASAVGVHLIDVGGAMATMTAEGVPAANAATYLRQMIISLAAPTKAASTSLADIGLTSKQVSDAMKQSLPGALQLIMQHLQQTYTVGSPQYVNALKNIAGGSKQMQGMLDLTGAHLKEFQSNVQAVASTINQGKGSVVGWAQVQQDFNFKVEQAKAAFQVLLITVGQQLLPVFSQLLKNIVPMISSFAQWLVSSGALKNALSILVNTITTLVNVGTAVVTFFQQNQVASDLLVAALIVLGAIIIGVIVVAIYAWAVAAWAAAAANIAAFWPVYLVVAAIVIIIGLVILVIQHWGQIVGWLAGVWNAFASWFMGILHAIGNFFTVVWSAIAATAMSIWNAIVSFFMSIWNKVSAAFIAVWNVIKTILTVVWNVIKMAAFVIFAIIVAIIMAPFVPLIKWFQAHWAQIQQGLMTVWNAIKAAASAVWNAISAVFTTVMNIIKSVITAVWDFISPYLMAAWNVISSVATSIWNGISSFFSWVMAGIQAGITFVWNAISAALTFVWNTISSAASSIWNTISSGIQGVVTTLQGWLSSAWNTIYNGAMGMWNGLQSGIEGVWNGIVGGIKAAINFVIGLINGMIDSVNSITGVLHIPAIPHIPYLAKGGMNLAQGLYVVGDAGPEILQLPGGSNVYPMGKSPSVSPTPVGAAGGYNGPSVVEHHTHLDRRQLIQLLGGDLTSEIRLQLGLRR